MLLLIHKSRAASLFSKTSKSLRNKNSQPANEKQWPQIWRTLPESLSWATPREGASLGAATLGSGAGLGRGFPEATPLRLCSWPTSASCCFPGLPLGSGKKVEREQRLPGVGTRNHPWGLRSQGQSTMRLICLWLRKRSWIIKCVVSQPQSQFA